MNLMISLQVEDTTWQGSQDTQINARDVTDELCPRLYVAFLSPKFPWRLYHSAIDAIAGRPE